MSITFGMSMSVAVPYTVKHIEPRPSFGGAPAEKLPASVYFCAWCGMQAVLYSTDADHVEAPHRGCPCPTLLKSSSNKVKPGICHIEWPYQARTGVE